MGLKPRPTMPDGWLCRGCRNSACKCILISGLHLFLRRNSEFCLQGYSKHHLSLIGWTTGHVNCYLARIWKMVWTQSRAQVGFTRSAAVIQWSPGFIRPHLESSGISNVAALSIPKFPRISSPETVHRGPSALCRYTLCAKDYQDLLQRGNAGMTKCACSFVPLICRALGRSFVSILLRTTSGGAPFPI